jgi:pimeloyl-ACP methyl ester carboxylesterase
MPSEPFCIQRIECGTPEQATANMAAVERQYVDTRFGQSHLYRAGPAAGGGKPPLVCFHMSPWSGVYFQPLLAQLGEDRLAIAIDTPGYGNSDATPAEPTMADYAGAMADVVDGLGLTSFDVLGDRTGAKIALELARMRGNQVRRIMLVSPVVWTDEERDRRQTFPKEVPATDGSHLVSAWLITVGLSMPGRTLEMLGDIFFARHMQLKIAHWGRRAAAGYDARATLDQINKPILVLRPKDDLWSLTPRVRPHLQHPASDIRDLPDWGYGFLEVKVAQTAAIVREFLDNA